jgi:hypothetical protein
VASRAEKRATGALTPDAEAVGRAGIAIGFIEFQ